MRKHCGIPRVPSTNQPIVLGLWLSSGAVVTAWGYRVGGLLGVGVVLVS